MEASNTIVDILRHRAEVEGDSIAYTFLLDGEDDRVDISYAELDRRARSVAAYLRDHGYTERVLLLYPPGPEFLAGFLGCLYADLTSVPAYPPHRNRPDGRLELLARDAGATVVLSDAHVLEDLERASQHAPYLQDLDWIATDRLTEDLSDHWKAPRVEPGSLAYLQYTSGSTSAPKGVMVTHANLLHNSACLRDSFSLGPSSISVSWLPTFHDMGLVDGVIQPLYTGYLGVLMPPVAFLRKPIRWLRAITDYGGTHAGGPNMAYALCVKKTSEEEREGLDLSSWIQAYNGAEPIRPETLEAFAATFRPYGFRSSYLCPGYGLAEATLMVSTGPASEEPVYCHCDVDALEAGEIVESPPSRAGSRTLVSSGLPARETEVAIVDPVTMSRCPRDRVGEIWVSGPSVTLGYWQNQDATAETFGAHIAESGEGPFLRTGDMGFVRNGFLFVAGRLKDLIIIRGRNHYPQDIELSVERSHPAIRPHGGAAFSVDFAGEERLVLVQEIKRTHLRQLDSDAVIEAMRQVVGEEHDIQLFAVVLLKPGHLPKTSSGKIARMPARKLYLEGRFDPLANWQLELADAASGRTAEVEAAAVGERRKLTDIRNWIVLLLANKFNLDVTAIDTSRPFTDYGLDSLSALEITERLQDWFGRRLEDSTLWDYPTSDSLAEYLHQLQGENH